MPALVNSNVGSFAGKSGLERTRVWPCRSKYSRNFSRISEPVIIKSSLACVITAKKQRPTAFAAEFDSPAASVIQTKLPQKNSEQTNALLHQQLLAFTR